VNDPLQVTLPAGWRDYTDEVPGGLTTFMRDHGAPRGVLQLSVTLYKRGKVPNPSEADLMSFAQAMAVRQKHPKLVESYGGACALGTLGTAIFHTDDFPRFQVWFLSNGQDFILATYICDQEPEPAEVAEAQAIVENATLSPRSAGTDA
jgi:hypothetical protein